MVSLITSSNVHTLILPLVSSFGLATNLKIRTVAGLVGVKKERFFGFIELKRTKRKSEVLCKGSLESEAELVLEKEILEFMKSSKNPNDFPTKKELLDAGRIDLVNAIIKKGGWLSFGWDDSDDENDSDYKKLDDFDDLNTRPDHYLSSYTSSHQFASSSGRSIEREVQEDAGIEGILHRLEKHRSLSFGVGMQENGRQRHYVSPDMGESATVKPFSDITATETYLDEKSNREEITSNDIKSRLQQMQLELSSSLCLLRSQSETHNMESHIRSSGDLQHLSDAWEFQENEIMNAKDKLRSVRAELAVLEGKMALSIINSQKLVDAKQKRIDSARRTLQLLHTTCIIWPNSASEVLLAGSFDGWTTQRKMKRSETGVFSLSLKLYPGRYEIKFIVDGVWRVDPLRPVVNYSGYENNILIIND